MEAIKTSDNVEFDVIYADGTRHRVKEGILFEVDGVDMVAHNGTNRLSVLFAVAESALELIDLIGMTSPFAEGLKGCDLEAPGRKVLAKICNEFCSFSAEKQATFRLGQMDMKASAVDMLRAMAQKNLGIVRSSLILAADLVESMEVPHADT